MLNSYKRPASIFNGIEYFLHHNKTIFHCQWKMMMIDVLRAHLCTQQAKWTELAPNVYANAEIRIQVVVNCGPTRCQLDHGGCQWKK